MDSPSHVRLYPWLRRLSLLPLPLCSALSLPSSALPLTLKFSNCVFALLPSPLPEFVYCVSADCWPSSHAVSPPPAFQLWEAKDSRRGKLWRLNLNLMEVFLRQLFTAVVCLLIQPIVWALGCDEEGWQVKLISLFWIANRNLWSAKWKFIAIVRLKFGCFICFVSNSCKTNDIPISLSCTLCYFVLIRKCLHGSC